MRTMRVVEADEEIYQGETRKLGDLQTALAKIAGCVNYKRFCETLDLTEDDFTFKQWQQFNDAVRIAGDRIRAGGNRRFNQSRGRNLFKLIAAAAGYRVDSRESQRFCNSRFSVCRFLIQFSPILKFVSA